MSENIENSKSSTFYVTYVHFLIRFRVRMLANVQQRLN